MNESNFNLTTLIRKGKIAFTDKNIKHDRMIISEKSVIFKIERNHETIVEGFRISCYSISTDFNGFG